LDLFHHYTEYLVSIKEIDQLMLIRGGGSVFILSYARSSRSLILTTRCTISQTYL